MQIQLLYIFYSLGSYSYHITAYFISSFYLNISTSLSYYFQKDKLKCFYFSFLFPSAFSSNLVKY